MWWVDSGCWLLVDDGTMHMVECMAHSASMLTAIWARVDTRTSVEVPAYLFVVAMIAGCLLLAIIVAAPVIWVSGQ